MSVLIKGGRIVTASDDYVGDVYVENGTVTPIGESLDVDRRQGDRRHRQVRDPGRDRPAHAHRDVLRRHDHVRRLHVGHRRGRVRRHDVARRLLHAGAGHVVPAGARELLREDRALQAGDRRRLPHRRHRPARAAAGSRRSRSCPTRGSPPTSSSWPTRAPSWSTTRRSSRPWRSRPRPAALVMVHAENGDAIDVIVKEAVAEGKSDPIWHARTRPMETEAEATNRAIQLARVAERRLYVVHVSCQPAVEPIAARAREGLGRLGRDLHAVPVRRRLGAREAGLRGREVHLHAAAAAEGAPGAPLEGAPERRPLGRLHRPLPVQLARAEGDQRPGLPGRPERRAGDREPAAHAPRVRRPHRAASR